MIAQRVVREVTRVGVRTVGRCVLAVEHEIINIPAPRTPDVLDDAIDTAPSPH